MGCKIRGPDISPPATSPPGHEPAGHEPARGGFGPVERKPVRTKAQQNEKPNFEPVYNKLCVGTVFAASGNVTTET